MAENDETGGVNNEAAKINKDIQEQLRQSAVTQEEYNQAKERSLELEEEIVSQEKELAKLEEARQERQQRIIAAQQAHQQGLTKQAELETEIARLKQRQTEVAGLYKMQTEKQLEKAEENLRHVKAGHRQRLGNIDKEKKAEDNLAKKKLEQEKKIKKLQKEKEKHEKNSKKEVQEALDSQDKMEKVISNYAREIPLIGDALGKAFQIKGNLKKFAGFLGDLGEAVGGSTGAKLAKAGQHVLKFASTVSFMALAVTIAAVAFVAKIASMALSVNNLSKDLAAATGFGDQFNEEITRMATKGHMAGIGFQESANALKSMTEGMSSFNPAAEESNIQVGLTIARLEKLGVAAGSSTKAIDHMERAMGLSATAAANMTAQIARLGKTIGISGTKMIEQFNAASGRLAIFGNNNIKVFKKLAAAAKATGIEMGTLINVSKQFDAFDTAADSAAKLNAVLGTQLSTIELMNANDADRVMMIKQQVQASVGNFDSLDKFTKMYIAQAMGVSDVAEAQRLLNMSTAEYQKYQKGQQESADIQNELAEATEKVVPVMQQLKLAGLAVFMAFAPLMEMIAGILSTLAPALTWLGEWIAKLTPIVLVVASVMKIFGLGIAAASNPIGWIIIGITALIGLFKQLQGIFGMRVNPIFAQIFHFLSEGLTMMMAPLKFVGKGVSALTGAFSGLFGTAKKDSAALTEGGFDIKAMAEIDTSKIAAGFREVKSAVMELSNIKVNGMLAFTSDGSKTSMIMGSVAAETAMLLNGGKLEVEVKMGEFKVPKIDVKVYIGDTELKNLIRQEVALSHIG